MSKRAVTIGTALLCAVLAACGGTGEDPDPGPTTTSSPPAPTGPPAAAAVDTAWIDRVDADRNRAAEVAAALDVLSADPASVFSAAAAARAADADPSGAVPPGSRVEVDDSTWAPDGINGGTIAVTITPPRAESARYLALVVREGATWKIDATYPYASAPTSGPTS